MKNITKLALSSVLALCSVALFLQAGCNILDPHSSSTWNPMAGLPAFITSRYDLSNIVGVMEPRQETYHIISQDTNWNGTQSWCQANFANANGNPLNIGTVIFNTPLNLNTSAPTTGDYYIDPLPIYTDGVAENHVQITPYNSSDGSVNDSLTCSVVPNITNITFNQNLSRDSTITVNWTGTSGDYVSLSINTWDTTGTNDTIGRGLAVGGYYNNTGSATIPVHEVLALGIANVELIVFSPHFFTLSNGKRIAVMLQTCEEITVHIVD